MQELPIQDREGGAAENVRAADAAAARPHRFPGGRVGLQGKLVLSFAGVLAVALAASYWVFAFESRRCVAEIMGDQARQLTYSLALASKPSLAERNEGELRTICSDLLKAPNVLFVAFLDPAGNPITLSGRAAVNWDALAPLRRNPQEQARLHQETSSVYGDYLAVMSPVFGAASMPHAGASPSPPESPSRVLGYVVVGLSRTREQAMLRGINLLISGVGALMVLLTVPLAMAVVHRIFQPIRELVQATRRLASGDLGARAATNRQDVIGTLARSFNDMVMTVRAQQNEVEDANAKLAQANVKLAEANLQLEQKVHERTEQLEAANRRLSSEIAEKEDFLRAVSHDLNAPLRNISGMATMLLLKHRTKFDEDVIHRLERIQKNVQVETDLISELLELSRIKTRRQKVEIVALDALVRELADVFEDDLKTRGIELIFDTPLPALVCERARLRQVFQNLIDNAIKYMGDGQRDGRNGANEIHVGCTVGPSEAEFYVRDAGIGIDAEDLDKVFFIFRRGKSAAVQNVPGKGVGLASVKSIVETYSGSIWVESEPGKGSTFRFTINGEHLAASAQALPDTPPSPTGLAA